MGQLQNQFQQMMGGRSPYSGGGGQQRSMGLQQGMGRGYAGGQQRGNFGDPRYQQPQTRGSGAYSGQPQARPQQPWSEFEPQRPQQAPIQRGIDQMPGRGGAEPSFEEMEKAVNAKYGKMNMSPPMYRDQASREQSVRREWAEDQRRGALTPQQQQAEDAQKQAERDAYTSKWAETWKQNAPLDRRNAQPQQGTTAPPTQQGYIPQQSQADMVPGQGPTRQPPVGPPPGTGGIKPQREPVGPPVPSTTPPNPAQQRIDPSRVQASAAGQMQGGSVSPPLGQIPPNPQQAARRRGYQNPYKKQGGYGGGMQPDGGPEFMY